MKYDAPVVACSVERQVLSSHGVFFVENDGKSDERNNSSENSESDDDTFEATFLILHCFYKLINPGLSPAVSCFNVTLNLRHRLSLNKGDKTRILREIRVATSEG